MNAALQAQSKIPSKSSITAVPSGILQRKYDCGRSPGFAGEFHEYGKQKLSPQRSTRNPELETGDSCGVPTIVHEVLNSPGQPLDPQTRAFMEPRFGHDFGKVRIHAGSKATELARSVSALAFTVGSDIVLGKDNIDFGMRKDREMIAHELTHVVQQSGHTLAQTSNITLTRPHDESEREAAQAANRVASGEGFLPQTPGGVVLARQMDAGAPPDIGVPDGPRDAGPIAGVPEPSSIPAPAPTPALAPPTPAATIGAVAFRGTANRIAPTQTAIVPVTVSGLPAGGSARIDVEGSGGANGSATITAGASLAGSGTVTVRGGTQTTPGNAGNLRLRATVGGAVVGRSPGFTVAAYPINYTDTYLSDINDGTLLGMVVQDGWSSDGSGAISELDQVEISERVDMQSRDNPPFTIPGATSATSGTSGYNSANTLTKDTFQMAKASINTTGLGFGEWTRVQGQLCLFKCLRTGVTDVVMPSSGYRIIQRVYNLSPSPGWKHQTEHVPADITVEGRRATAGGGTAQSPEHNL
jgi:hypothetical protein